MSWIEIDSLGIIEVFDDVYWGVQIQCLLENFVIGGQCMLFVVIYVLVLIKKVVVWVNDYFGELLLEVVWLIEQVVDEVFVGCYDEYFLLVVWQIGSGIQINMNVNEVIVGCVNELVGNLCGGKLLVYFNDYVNCVQSFNDSFFIVMYIVVVKVVYE